MLPVQNARLNVSGMPQAPGSSPCAAALCHHRCAEFWAIHDALCVYTRAPQDKYRVALFDACFELWFSRAKSQNVPLGPVYLMLCDNAAHKSIDQHFRRRNGWAKRNIDLALALWPMEVFNAALTARAHA